MADNQAVEKGNSTLLGANIPPTPRDEKNDSKNGNDSGNKNDSKDNGSDKDIGDSKDNGDNKNNTNNKNNNNKNIQFKTAHPSQTATIMTDSTEVIDVDDVIYYKNNFDTSNATNLIPYVIYMDAGFNQVVKSKKRNKALMLLLKVFGGVVVFILIVVLIKKVFFK